jgi:hypothetical protein
MTIAIVVLAAIALLLFLFHAVRGNPAASIDGFDDLPQATVPIDLPAFLNLIDPKEGSFLRANLTPGIFRQIQRERLLATGEYVNRMAKNAAVLVRLGQTESADANPEISTVGKELEMAAIKLRALALLALALLYVQIVFPQLRLSLLRIPSRYENLVNQVARLAKSKQLVQVSRIVCSM